jgi:hypothetical protein
MTNNASTFTPSTQILEAAEQAQALADAGKALKPFLPQETQQAVEGVGKIADALNATGQALKHFGFDEYEDEVIGDSTREKRLEGVKQVAELFPPKQLEGPLDIAGKINAAVDYNNYDPNNPMPTTRKIEEAVRNNDTKAINRYKITPVTSGSQIIHEHSVKTFNDPNASAGDKFVAGAADAFTQTNPVINQAKSVETVFSAIGHFTGWWDEMELDPAEGPVFVIRPFKGEFNSVPETLEPIDLNSSVVTDTYQQQNDPGVDFIGGQTNQGTEHYQAQDEKYAVLA